MTSTPEKIVRGYEPRITEVVSPSLCNPSPALGLQIVKPKAGRMHQMDGLRGIAMLFVFLGHFGAVWSQVTPSRGSAAYFLQLVNADATLGSSFFMLLSGFFAYGSLLRSTGKFTVFLFGRLRRLYPMYLVMVVIYVAGSLAVPRMSKLPPNAGAAAVFLFETLLLLPGLLPIAPLIDVSWTLSFIVLFYFVEAGSVRLFRKMQSSRMQRFVLLVLAAVVWACFGNATNSWQPRTGMFWTGMALLEAVEGLSSRMDLATRITLPAAVITALGLWANTYVGTNGNFDFLLPASVVGFVITSITLSAFLWIARFGPSWWKGLLSRPLLCQLGAASYSFYLTHGFTVKAFRFAIVPLLGASAALPVVFWTGQLLGVVASVAMARAAYVLIENPIAQWVPMRLPIRTREMRGTATPV